MTTKRSTWTVAVATGAVLALGLTGCGGDDKDPSSSSSTSASSSPSSSPSPSATPSRPPVSKGKLVEGYPSKAVPVAQGKVKRSTKAALTADGKQVDGWTVQLSFPGTLAEVITKVKNALAAKGYEAGDAKRLGGKVQEIVFTSDKYENRADFIPVKRKNKPASVTVLYNITKR